MLMKSWSDVLDPHFPPFLSFHLFYSMFTGGFYLYLYFVYVYILFKTSFTNCHKKNQVTSRTNSYSCSLPQPYWQMPEYISFSFKFVTYSHTHLASLLLLLLIQVSRYPFLVLRSSFLLNTSDTGDIETQEHWSLQTNKLNYHLSTLHHPPTLQSSHSQNPKPSRPREVREGASRIGRIEKEGSVI